VFPSGFPERSSSGLRYSDDMIRFSILDLCPIPEGGTAADAFRHSLDLAQHAEDWGYHRFWLAEHHNMPGVASAATSVVIAHVAGGTKKIRVGSGGVMLPNHNPLAIAEQFGTLATLFPDRIDLGLGRSFGTDMLTARALRRDAPASADQYQQDIIELQDYFRPAQPGQKICSVPGAGLNVPVWLLGSSIFSAQLAAQLGLPFAFASHVAPTELMRALSLYRSQFKPSEQLDRPYAMTSINCIAADTDSQARRLFTSVQQTVVNLHRGTPRQIQPPIDDIDAYCSPTEKAFIDQALARAIVGSPESVGRGLRDFIADIQVDELIISANIYEHAARLKSFAIIAEIRDRLG
jgi:luciferase family oxidoreductase group 1